MRQIGRLYPSDLSEQQWKLISDYFPKARTGGRSRTTDVQKVLNAIFYLSRSGCAWRYLPREYPPWQTVYMYYAQWMKLGVIKKVHDALVAQVRQKEGRNPLASTLVVDSQSSKARWGECRGYDGFKKVQGRKRSIFVDTLGLIHSVQVDRANRKDHEIGLEMLDPERKNFPHSVTRPLNAFYGDGGYKPHDFQNRVEKIFGIFPTLKSAEQEVKWKKVGPTFRDWKSEKVIKSSNLKPVRWVVERTFAWLNYYRRLTRDHERTTSSSEAMVYIAMTRLMFNRLSNPKQTYKRWS